MALIDNPSAILYDENGIQLAVTASQAIPSGSSGFLGAGVDSTGTVRYFNMTSNGTLMVSGSVTASIAPNSIVAQGLSGSHAQAWNVVLSDGTKAIGTGSTAPLFTQDANVSLATLNVIGRNASSVVLLASNPARKGAFIFNDATGGSPNLFVAFAATATAVSYSARIGSGGTLDVPSWYTGIISGIWAGAGAGSAKITEG